MGRRVMRQQGTNGKHDNWQRVHFIISLPLPVTGIRFHFMALFAKLFSSRFLLNQFCKWVMMVMICPHYTWLETKFWHD